MLFPFYAGLEFLKNKGLDPSVSIEYGARLLSDDWLLGHKGTIATAWLLKPSEDHWHLHPHRYPSDFVEHDFAFAHVRESLLFQV